MTLAFLSGFKSVGPGPGTDQGGSRVCVSVRHALLICEQGPLPVRPSVPTPSPLPQPLKRGPVCVVLQINH